MNPLQDPCGQPATAVDNDCQSTGGRSDVSTCTLPLDSHKRLRKLMEKYLGTSFLKTNCEADYLRRNVPKDDDCPADRLFSIQKTYLKIREYKDPCKSPCANNNNNNSNTIYSSTPVSSSGAIIRNIPVMKSKTSIVKQIAQQQDNRTNHNSGVCGCAPKSNDCSSKRNDCAPKSNDCAPKRNDCASKSNDCAPKRNDCASKSNECAPKRNDCASKSNDCGPKRNDCASKSNDCGPKRNDCASKSNDCAPKNNDCASKSYDSTSKNSNYTSKSYESTSKNSNYTSKSYESTSKNSNYTSKSYESASKNSNCTSKSNCSCTSQQGNKTAYDELNQFKEKYFKNETDERKILHHLVVKGASYMALRLQLDLMEAKESGQNFPNKQCKGRCELSKKDSMTNLNSPKKKCSNTCSGHQQSTENIHDGKSDTSGEQPKIHLNIKKDQETKEFRQYLCDIKVSIPSIPMKICNQCQGRV